MSDPAAAPSAPANPGLRDRILAAPEELWQKLATELGVQSREEAVALVESDENAAAQAEAILGSEATLLTSSKGSAGTTPSRSPAESLYPSMGGGRRGKGVQF